MNYNLIYTTLIERGRTRVLESYKERHHIIPRCMGGSDEPENLVDLTPEEHYLAHQLLVKIHPNNYKLVKAASMMIPSRPNNKMYGWLRRKLSEAKSQEQSGSGNSQFGTRWIHCIESNSSKKIKIEDALPSGFSEGRTIPKLKGVRKIPNLSRPVLKCLACINQENMKQARYWYDLYTKSTSTSIRDFVRNSDYDKSHVSFIKMLKKHVPEFCPVQGKSYG